MAAFSLDDSTSTTSGLNTYTQFLIFLISFILIIAGLMCCARVFFLYCTFRRRQEELTAIAHHRTTATTVGTQPRFSYPREECGVTNYGFADHPPCYDQICKDDEPPPLYETLKNLRSPVPKDNEEMGAREQRITEDELPHSGSSQPTAHAPSPPQSRMIICPSDDRSGRQIVSTIPMPDECGTNGAISISASSQQIQDYMDAVRQRFSVSN